MPKYFCEYCGIYLIHSSPKGRRQHNGGRKHKQNKIEYYQQFLQEINAPSNLSTNNIPIIHLLISSSWLILDFPTNVVETTNQNGSQHS